MTNLLAGGILSVQMLLPAFNQFAERAALDGKLPLETNRITKSHIGTASPMLMATFDGRHQFHWHSSVEGTQKGRIYYLDLKLNGSSGSLVFRQFTNQNSTITTNEAKDVAEACLKNLGIDIRTLNVGEPIVGQFTFQENAGDVPMPIPLFGVRWFTRGVKEPEWNDRLVEIQVSGVTKKIAYFSISPTLDDVTGFDLRQFKTNQTDKARAP